MGKVIEFSLTQNIVLPKLHFTSRVNTIKSGLSIGDFISTPFRVQTIIALNKNMKEKSKKERVTNKKTPIL